MLLLLLASDLRHGCQGIARELHTCHAFLEALGLVETACQVIIDDRLHRNALASDCFRVAAWLLDLVQSEVGPKQRLYCLLLLAFMRSKQELRVADQRCRLLKQLF